MEGGERLAGAGGRGHKGVQALEEGGPGGRLGRGGRGEVQGALPGSPIHICILFMEGRFAPEE